MDPVFLTQGVAIVQNHPKLRLMRRQWQLYLFLVLPVAYLILFHYVPMAGLQIAFRKFSARGGVFGSPWVGLYHFEKFFTSRMFERVLKNTILLSVYSIFVGFPIPVLFALMLNSMNSLRYKKLVQTVTYIPHFISVVVLVGMVMLICNPATGLYGLYYKAFHNGIMPSEPLASPSVFTHIYVWSGIWQGFGWGSIIFVAALAGVSPELHEAAEIDGASRLQRLWHIDLPAIVPTAIIMLILRCGQVMSIGFEKIYLMQNSLNLSASEVISTYVYKVGLANSVTDFSYSTAIGLFNSFVNMLLIASVNFLAGKTGETSLW